MNQPERLGHCFDVIQVMGRGRDGARAVGAGSPGRQPLRSPLRFDAARRIPRKLLCHPLPAGQHAFCRAGVRDLHGVAWEWVEDAGGMLVSEDGRQSGDGGNRFCGAGATSFEQKENYAMLMRIAMLSSMKSSYTSSSMSFRCAADVEKK